MSRLQVFDCILKIRLNLQMGHSLQKAIEVTAQEGGNHFAQSILVFLRRVRAGQKACDILASLPELQSTGFRKALVLALDRGLHGAPIDKNLERLQEEAFLLLDAAHDRRMQLLPFKLLVPLTLLVLPGFMILILGPLLFTLEKL
jgi:hypothetical protein